MNEPWRREAACAGKDPNDWFPEQTGYSWAHKRALDVCRSCPVQLACLRSAIDNNEHHGIWGGLTAQQRTDLRRNRRGLKELMDLTQERYDRLP